MVVPLILITLDSQKTVDVVDHIILLDKFYESIPSRALWMIVQNLYEGLTSKIKWKDNISNSFEIKHGYVKLEYCPLSSTNYMSTISWKILNETVLV